MPSAEQAHDRLDSHSCERKASLRGKIIIPEYSAAVIGSSVVLRVYGGGLTGLSYALTTVPFPTPEAAAEWIEANKFDMAYSAKLGVAPG
jgi:hypothetical protein